MVSSKCLSVVSPSPLRFLAALMPPCAQTECERFTGTMEKRSTSPPISAILMTAARPARPPPTTMIFGVTAMLLRVRSAGRGRPALHALLFSTYYFSLPHYDVSRRRIRIKPLGWRPQKSVDADSADRNQAEGERKA